MNALKQILRFRYNHVILLYWWSWLYFCSLTYMVAMPFYSASLIETVQVSCSFLVTFLLSIFRIFSVLRMSDFKCLLHRYMYFIIHYHWCNIFIANLGHTYSFNYFSSFHKNYTLHSGILEPKLWLVLNI